MNEIIGVTFPIRKSFIPRFFEDGKTVFIKPATTFKNLRKGLRFIFYQSQKDIGFVGEAIIEQITFSEDPFSFFDIYGEDIFLTKEELLKYIEDSKKWSRKRRKSEPRIRKWLAIKLESMQAYDAPIKPQKFVPLGGQYIKSDI